RGHGRGLCLGHRLRDHPVPARRRRAAVLDPRARHGRHRRARRAARPAGARRRPTPAGPRAPGRPAPPPPPRLHDRRPVPALPRLAAVLQLPDDRRPPITPQLALRVAILGGIALVAFAVIFFRLWFLQVLSGDRYLAQANDNRVRDVVTAAPRGDVVDRDGRALVENRVAIVAQVEPDKLPPPGPRRT